MFAVTKLFGWCGLKWLPVAVLLCQRQLVFTVMLLVMLTALMIQTRGEMQ